MLDAVNKASRFEDAKVNFARFTTDASLLDREDIRIWSSGGSFERLRGLTTPTNF